MSETARVEEDKYPGLIVTNEGVPYKTREALSLAMAKKKIKTYDVVNIDGGFAAKAEKFHRVRFQAKASPNDPEDVQLSVNGETLVISREKEVIIPDRFKECADHATFPIFRQMPNLPRKITGRIRLFPYDLLGQATEGEYLAEKADGTRKTKDIIKKYGSDVEPDTLEND